MTTTELTIREVKGLTPTRSDLTEPQINEPSAEIPNFQKSLDELLEPYKWMDGLTTDILKNSIVPKIADLARTKSRIPIALSNDMWVEGFFDDLNTALKYVRTDDNPNLMLSITVATASSNEAKKNLTSSELTTGAKLTSKTDPLNMKNLLKALKILKLCRDKVFIQPPFSSSREIGNFCSDFDNLTHLAGCRIQQAEDQTTRDLQTKATSAVSQALFGS